MGWTPIQRESSAFDGFYDIITHTDGDILDLASVVGRDDETRFLVLVGALSLRVSVVENLCDYSR